MLDFYCVQGNVCSIYSLLSISNTLYLEPLSISN